MQSMKNASELRLIRYGVLRFVENGEIPLKRAVHITEKALLNLNSLIGVSELSGKQSDGWLQKRFSNHQSAKGNIVPR
ncbi:hypothetical protein AA0229_2538 [Gluconobacter cerinus NRIC 0229]|nr:hypothetical protein AA0229_2538 [Gluconobacter cerinus NRIC 0229]